MYLTGAITQTALNHPRPDLGFMANPGNGQIAGALGPFIRWAADNGCYAQGERFDPGDWLEWLAGLRRHRGTCLFAVAPDVVGDAAGTLRRALPFLPTIRQLGFPAAFASQDGATADLIPWDSIDALFVGGTTGWKFSEPSVALLREAKARGKHAHMGRVNSLQRLRACSAALVDSADGTYVAFAPDRNLPRVYDWLDAVNAQATLEASA